jgi:hypothetical protein
VPLFGLKRCLTNSQHSPAKILLSGPGIAADLSLI